MVDDRPGGEPTEEPSPRRLRRAREEGDVPRSGDLTSSLAFLAACAALAAGASPLATRLVARFERGLAQAVSPDPPTAGAALGGALRDLAASTWPLLGAAFVVAVCVGALQAGGFFTLQPLVPQGRRVSPFAGFKRLLSGEALAATARALAKLVVVAAVASWTIAPHLAELPRLTRVGAPAALAFAGGLGMRLVLRVAVAYALIGVADYLWQRRQWLRRNRMTREEVKREQKESEGDPRHKAERQRLHRELLRHRMVEAVQRADCVIVNPDHIAVALRWDEASMDAPEVVAKGERRVAEQIKEVARQSGVPIYRDVALAQALNRLELGDAIPEALYEAVAEVLRFLAADGKP